jgi:hypothetical protein
MLSTVSFMAKGEREAKPSLPSGKCARRRRPAPSAAEAFLGLIDPNQPKTRNHAVIAETMHRALIGHIR